MTPKQKSLDAAVVSLIVEINSLQIRNKRSPEDTEYRRGFQEALTGLSNSVPMIDVVDALRELGWEAPRTHWRSPPVPQQTASEEADRADG